MVVGFLYYIMLLFVCYSERTSEDVYVYMCVYIKNPIDV